jgi:hypothetical protein
LKLYSSDAGPSVNGHGPLIDNDEPIEDDDFEGGEYDFSTLFDAPNYSDFIKIKDTAKARTYERRVQSMMKAGMIASLNNRQFPDAATFLKHGPGFAKAAGNLASEDARAAQVIDMLTAPDSPYVMFALVALPLFGQLVRNHQPELIEAGGTFKQKRAERKQAKKAGMQSQPIIEPVTVHVFKREIKLPIRLRIKLPKFKNMFKAFLAPTQHPGELAHEVFGDPGVQKALHKLGIFPRSDGGSDE